MLVILQNPYTDYKQAVWKGTRRWTQNALDKASERIVNAQPVEDDDDEDEDSDAGVHNVDAQDRVPKTETTSGLTEEERLEDELLEASIKTEDFPPESHLRQRF